MTIWGSWNLNNKNGTCSDAFQLKCHNLNKCLKFLASLLLTAFGNKGNKKG